MEKITEKAHAKINLTLTVGKKHDKLIRHDKTRKK